MTIVTIKQTYVVAEYEGKYWGVQDFDRGQGGFVRHDFGSIEKAETADPNHCRKPTDLTYRESPHYMSLLKARLVPLTVTTIYEVEP